jgi:hypothetical protein
MMVSGNISRGKIRATVQPIGLWKLPEFPPLLTQHPSLKYHGGTRLPVSGTQSNM